MVTEIRPNDPYAAAKHRTLELMHVAHRTKSVRPVFEKPCTLAEFVHEFWEVLEPATPLVWGWYLDTICAHLEAVSDGRIRNLILNFPPRFSKSTIVAVMWPCWEWTFHPEKKFLFSSYGARLSERDSRACRKLIHSEQYQSKYGKRFKLAASHDLKDTVSKFENSRGGYRIATSVGGVTTGEGADVVVCDDPIKADDGNSDIKRNAANQWWSETMSSRLNNLRTGAKVLVMQRLHEEDLTGYWIEKNGAEIQQVCLPMEFETVDGQGKPIPRRSTILGEYDPRTQEGELLCPERAGPPEILQLKAENTDYSWSGQYQQHPSPRGGGMFRIDKIEIVESLPPAARLIRARSWDRAGTEGGGAFTAGARMAMDVDDRTIYIEDMVRGQWSTDQREAITKETALKDGKLVYVLLEQEPGSSGLDSVKATARMLQGFSVIAIRPTGSKEVRAEPMANQSALGTVKLVRGAWNGPFLKEAENFPIGRYRDQIDSGSMGYNWLTGLARPAGRAVSTEPPQTFVPR